MDGRLEGRRRRGGVRRCVRKDDLILNSWRGLEGGGRHGFRGGPGVYVYMCICVHIYIYTHI